MYNIRCRIRKIIDGINRHGETPRQLNKALKGRPFSILVMSFLLVLIYSRYITELNYYVVIDNGEMTIHRTYTKDAMTALEEAGISLSNSDYVSLPEPMSGGFAEVYIERSQTVTVKIDGIVKAVTIFGGSVASALEACGYVPDVRDVVVPSLGAPLTDGLAIEVIRKDVYTEQVVEILPYETIIQSNQHINKGTEVVTQEGSLGEKVYTYAISMENGKEISRRLVLEVVTAEPVNEIIQQGTGNFVTTDSGEVLSYSKRLECIATAYTTEGYVNKINALGRVARVGTIAVDPRVIPLRSTVYVTSTNGKWVYGKAVCEDTGGVIKGNKVDLFFDTRAECFNFGVRKCWVYILD